MSEPKYRATAAELAEIDNRFEYHPAKGDQHGRYHHNRQACSGLAEVILRNCPPSRERSLALTKLEEVMFWANAAIARNEQ